jgi:putative nucleotidyltransferase with HDIG domain
MMMVADEKASMLMEAIGDLPSLSHVLVRLSEIAANPASSARHVVDVVKLDPALTAKILRLANSAYVGIPRTIDSLKNAVVLLGQKRVYSLALTAGILLALKKRGPPPFSQRDYWRHSIAVGMIAESISKTLHGRDSIDSDEAFTAGLLHDIGKLAVGCFGASYFLDAVRNCLESKIPFFKAEKPATSHTTIGWLLARKWNFPDDLCSAIARHHDPAPKVTGNRMVSIVHLSDGIAHCVDVATIPGETPPELDAEAKAFVNVQPERLRAIAGEALQNEKKIELFIECIV